MRFLVLPAVAILIVAGALTGLLQQSTAEAKCQPPRPNDGHTYLAALWRLEATVTGAKATIWEYEPYVSSVYHPVPGYKQHSTAWTMIVGPDGGWAQSGWLEGREEYSNIYHRWSYAQWTNRWGSTWWTRTYNPRPLNTYSTYKVTDSDVFPNYFTFSWGPSGAEVPVTYAYAYFDGDGAQNAGEITSYINQMPGDPFGGGGEYFLDVQFQRYTFGAWYAFDGAIYANSNFMVYRMSTGRFYIYDRCDWY